MAQPVRDGFEVDIPFDCLTCEIGSQGMLCVWANSCFTACGLKCFLAILSLNGLSHQDFGHQVLFIARKPLIMGITGFFA